MFLLGSKFFKLQKPIFAMVFSRKAQGALEYLLIIGVAILIVVIVIVALSGVVGDTKDKNSVSDYDSQFDKLQDLQKKPDGSGSNDSIAEIISFKVDGTNGLIQEQNIFVILPYGTNLDNLPVEIDAIGVVNPNDSEIDFVLNSKKIFTVTSIDNKIQKDYSVVINYSPPVDEDPPVVNLISPTYDEKIYEENFIFEFSVNDNSSINNCKLLLNSDEYYTWNNISSGTYQKVVNLLGYEGTNMWGVICVDSRNNSSEMVNGSFEVIFNNDSAQVVFLSIGGYGGNIQNDSVQITLPGGTSLQDLPFNVVVENGTISPNNSRMSFSLGVPKNFTLISDDYTQQRNFSVTVNYLPGGVLGDYTIISSCQDLQNIDKKLNGKYKLMSDIDCAGFNFKPIGGNTGFSGYFNGNGFKIKNLSINNRNFNLSCVGLFGILKGEVRNLKVVGGNMAGYYSSSGGATLGGIAGRQDAGSLIINSSFDGVLQSKWNTGGIAGESSGTILNSYSSGHFYSGYSASKSSWLSIGGIVGHQKSGGVVKNCYSSAKVESTAGASNYTQQAAGLIGRSYGLIEDSYSYGQVLGPSASTSVYVLRGLVAADYNNNFYGTVVDSYWDKTTSGRNTSAGGVGLTTSEMKIASNFSDWNNEVWEVGNNNYPKLINICGDGYCNSLIDENCSTCPGDCGNCSLPYTIYNLYSCWDIMSISDFTGMYILMNDVNCASEGLENFEPIGSYNNEFKGFFYGNGYSINNLKIDSSTSFVGLFGALKGALISGVVLKDVEIKGENLVGGIAGSADSSSTIQYSLVTGKINSNGVIAGGLTGTGGEIINCYSDVKIN